MNVAKVAELLGVDRTAAYGLLRFLADADIVAVEKEEKVAGKRGRSSMAYKIDAAAVDKLSALLKEKLCEPANAPVKAGEFEVDVNDFAVLDEAKFELAAS